MGIRGPPGHPLQVLLLLHGKVEGILEDLLLPEGRLEPHYVDGGGGPPQADPGLSEKAGNAYLLRGQRLGPR